MLSFAADENFSGRIARGLQRRLPDLDIVRVQDTQMAGATDADRSKAGSKTTRKSWRNWPCA